MAEGRLYLPENIQAPETLTRQRANVMALLDQITGRNRRLWQSERGVTVTEAPMGQPADLGPLLQGAPAAQAADVGGQTGLSAADSLDMLLDPQRGVTVTEAPMGQPADLGPPVYHRMSESELRAASYVDPVAARILEERSTLRGAGATRIRAGTETPAEMELAPKSDPPPDYRAIREEQTEPRIDSPASPDMRPIPDVTARTRIRSGLDPDPRLGEDVPPEARVVPRVDPDPRLGEDVPPEARVVPRVDPDPRLGKDVPPEARVVPRVDPDPRLGKDVPPEARVDPLPRVDPPQRRLIRRTTAAPPAPPPTPKTDEPQPPRRRRRREEEQGEPQKQRLPLMHPKKVAFETMEKVEVDLETGDTKRTPVGNLPEKTLEVLEYSDRPRTNQHYSGRITDVLTDEQGHPHVTQNTEYQGQRPRRLPTSSELRQKGQSTIKQRLAEALANGGEKGASSTARGQGRRGGGGGGGVRPAPGPSSGGRKPRRGMTALERIRLRNFAPR